MNEPTTADASTAERQPSAYQLARETFFTERRAIRRQLARPATSRRGIEMPRRRPASGQFVGHGVAIMPTRHHIGARRHPSSTA